MIRQRAIMVMSRVNAITGSQTTLGYNELDKALEDGWIFKHSDVLPAESMVPPRIIYILEKEESNDDYESFY